MTIGTHEIRTFPAVDPPGVGVDVSCWVDRLTIRHGRENTSDQPAAAAVTMDLDLATVLGPFPAVEIGDRVTVTTTPPGGSPSTRFAGRVTDLEYSWTDAGTETPDFGTGQLIAVGYLADYGRRNVGEVAYPQELDGARVARVATAAGLPLDPAFSDPGRVQILAREIDPRNALEVMQDTAISAVGMVWYTRAGQVRYADSDHRRGVPVTLELDACDILITPAWKRDLGGLVNQVSIGYGPSGAEGTYTNVAAESIAVRDTYAYVAGTLLATLADASAFGNMLLARNSSPTWIMSALPVDIIGLDPARYQQLLDLEVGSLIRLTGLPVLGAAPTSAVLWVEGWTEALAYGTHDLELTVSGYCRTTPLPQWDQVPIEWTWDTVDPPTMTWDQASCISPLPSYGRWSDVPASLRWDQVPPATTWDTWKG
jgi:hypothetical protein